MTTSMSRMAARMLFVPVIVVAVAVLVKGASQVGDGFTAGLIAVLAVVVQYLAAGQADTERWLPLNRAGTVGIAGLLLSLAVAVQSLPRGEPLLTHWPPPGEEPPKFGKLELTTQLAFDLAVFLLILGAALAAVRAIFRTAGAEGEGRR